MHRMSKKNNSTALFCISMFGSFTNLPQMMPFTSTRLSIKRLLRVPQQLVSARDRQDEPLRATTGAASWSGESMELKPCKQRCICLHWLIMSFIQASFISFSIYNHNPGLQHDLRVQKLPRQLKVHEDGPWGKTKTPKAPV